MGVKSYHALCFNCRKAFKRSYKYNDWPGIIGVDHKCPQCEGTTYSLPGSYKIPRSQDKRAWDKLYKENKKFLRG